MFKIYAKTAHEGLLVRIGHRYGAIEKAISRAARISNALSVEIRKATPQGGEDLIHAFAVKPS